MQSIQSQREARKEEGSDKSSDESSSTSESSSSSSESSSSSASSWFSWVGKKNFYEGGFEDKMDRSEAARILGVRESASVKRIKAAHRRILMLNHPDTGGSTFIASKINEAKEMLLKGRDK